MGVNPKIARAALHFWEEPCISGTRGSGTVFFSGCTPVSYTHLAAIERGVQDVHQVEVPAEWKNAADTDNTVVATGDRPELVDFVNNILEPVNAQRGDKLPVSTFVKDADGTFPQGSAAYEKRGIAVDVPCWIPENCIQCNFCLLYTSRCV